VCVRVLAVELRVDRGAAEFRLWYVPMYMCRALEWLGHVLPQSD
jgi:hypothetical protein